MTAKLEPYTGFRFFESLFDRAKQNCVLVMDANGTILAVSPSFEFTFGYTESDLIGKNAAVLFTKKDQDAGMPQKEFSEVLTRGQSFDNNYLLNKDGSATWVSGESTLVKNIDGDTMILKVLQNIHQRKESELAIRRLNDFNERILSSIEDVVIVLDEKKQIIKYNNAFINLFKYGVPELTNLNFADLIRRYDDNNELQIFLDNAINTKSGFSNKQIEIDTPAGETRIFDVSCTPIQDPAFSHVLLIIHDITIYKQLEREREDVMGFVAHELRNPLSNVILCNELMSEALKDDNVALIADTLERSRNNVARLQRLIAELYDATKVNSGYLQMELSVFNFSEIIRESIDTVEVLQPAYHINVIGDGNVKVYGDRYRLIQVITNYLSNGIKYSNGQTEVTIAIEHDENTLTVSVKDEGLGISKEQIPYVFERFFRVEKTRNIEGIGLGLYLCRHIIQAHHGHVWVESKEGQGSTFYFSLPLLH